MSNITIPGFESFPSHRPKRNKRARRCSGGVILFVKQHLIKGVSVIKDDIPDIIWARLDKGYFGLENDLLLCLAYIMPSQSSGNAYMEHDIMEQIVLDIAKFADEYINPFYLIAGDLNSRVSSELDYVKNDQVKYMPLPDEYVEDDFDFSVRSTADFTVNARGKQLLELCQMCNLRILNGRVGNDKIFPKKTCFVYNGSSTVDLMLGSPSLFKYFVDFVVHDPLVFSDHAPVSLSLSVKHVPPAVHKCISRVEKSIWNDSKATAYKENLLKDNCTNMLSNMMNIAEDYTRVSTDINIAVTEALKCFTDGVRLASDPLFYKSFKADTFNENNIQNGPPPPPWADEEWYNRKKDFFKARDKVKQSPSDTNLKQMSDARRHYKNLTRQKQNSFDRSQTQKLLEARTKNVKLYWKMLSGQTKSPPIPVSTKDMYNHFLKLSNPNNAFFTADDDVSEEVIRIIENDIECMFSELDTEISAGEVKSAIKDLKRGKSGGADLLINELFIYDDAFLQPYLVSLFNFVFQSGVFPDSWSEGLISPLHKKGSKTEPDNYRAITLLSVLGKIFTRILNNRLDGWAEKYEIYIEAQNGFRGGRGTTDSIFILNQIINQILEKGQKLYAFFVDFSKAFDMVVHDNLWYKLLNIGITGKMFSIIHSMYNCLKTCVMVNGEKSDAFYCQLGVRQGECLSPFLFAMYINDLEKSIDSPDSGVTILDVKFLLLLYADDVVIFANSSQHLQNSIDRLYEYCNKWKLKINTAKSFIIIFCRRHMYTFDTWKYGDTVIPVTTQMRYLGLIFSSNGLAHQTQLSLSQQANKAVFGLHKKLCRYKTLSISVVIDLFDKFIVPVLNYGCESWGFHAAPNIERVQLRFYKRILRVKGTTQNDFIYGILGRFPMLIHRQYRIIRYWTKIILGKKSNYVNLLYASSLQNIDNGNNNNWAFNVRKLASQL